MPNKTRISKRVRAIMGVGLLAFVMTIGLTVAQPKPTKAAVCETPVTAVASVGLWLANSFGFLGDFGSTISDFLIADVETGQDEIQTRIEDTDENIRIGMSEWWNEDMLPAMKDGEKQLGAMRQTETMQRGMAIDMQEEARRQREIGDATADATIGADYTDMSCQADTIAAGGIAADNPSKPGSCRFEGSIFSNRQKTGIYNNQCANGETTKFYYECCNGTIETRQTQICGERQTSVPNCQGGTTDVPESTSNGGIGYSAKISDEIARGSSEEAAARATAEEGTPEAQGPAAVLADKWSNMTSAYCDPEANGGNMPCQTTNPEMVGKNIEMGSSLLWGEKLTIDMNREQNQKLFEDAMRTFVDQNPPQPIPEDILGNQRAIYQFNMTRANAARKNAVHSVMAQMMADRASRPANDALPSAQEIRTAAGLPASETTDLPSMNEITQALFQDRFTRPEFIAMVTKTPEELIKNNLDVSTGHLVQWNMMYKRLERLSVLYASEFARDLEYSEPDFVGDVPVVSREPMTRERKQYQIDPEGTERPACAIVDFDIPDDPFGKSGSSFNCTNVSGDQPVNPASSYSISENGLNLIKDYEKLKLCPYDDGAGYMTIGWGHLIKRGESFGCISNAQADALLKRDLADAEATVKRYVTADITQSQYDAMVSLVFNIGSGNFAGCSNCGGRRRPPSEVLTRTNAGDFAGAAEAFGSFVTSGGKYMRGLERRRNDERSLYGASCSGGWGEEQSKLAQCLATNDDATSGQCALGVRRTLEAMGLPGPVGNGHAYQYADGRMEAAGWTRVSCEPQNCPAGAVLVFDRVNPPDGRRGAGKIYGHVEIVTDVNGQRSYVSDATRRTPGGTVPDQYVGAYVYSGEAEPIDSRAQQCMDRIQ